MQSLICDFVFNFFSDTLLQAGANVNHVSNDGDSPLHRCVSHGCEVVLHYLLSSGADYNQVSAPVRQSLITPTSLVNRDFPESSPGRVWVSRLRDCWV